jgi:serine protease AprX
MFGRQTTNKQGVALMGKVRMLFVLVVLAALLSGGLSRGVAASTVAEVDPRLRAALVGATAPVQAVVSFHGNGAPTGAHLAALRGVGITRGVSFRSLPIVGVLLTGTQLDALAARPEVRSIFFNRALTYDNADGTALTKVDRVRTDKTMIAKNGGLPITGKGVGVVINDSGIDGTHRDLEFGPHLVQNVMASTNLNSLESSLAPIVYVENVPNTDSTGGHGTHVAGIVGGTGAQSGGKYEGVAPGADLIGWGSGAGLAILDVLGAFDYAITNQARYGIRVVTNSWGDTSDVGTPVNPNDPINIATYRCYQRNIVVVFSAGNSGRNGNGTITGNYKKAPWVINVAAGTKDYKVADFSSRGMPNTSGTFVMNGRTWTYVDRPTVTAPGQLIVSTRAISPIGALGTPDDIGTIDPAHLPFYTTLSGTSMAAPHVAGIVALMLEANPAMTPSQVKNTLQKTAMSMPGFTVTDRGAGYVNAYQAVRQAFELAGK